MKERTRVQVAAAQRLVLPRAPCLTEKVRNPNPKPKGTDLFIFRGLPIRDAESFGANVGETRAQRRWREMRRQLSQPASSSQTLARTGQERETPGSRLEGAGR